MGHPGFASAPVVTYAYLVARWTAFGNETLPDCTVAAEAELVEIWDAVAQRRIDFRVLDATVRRTWKQVRRRPEIDVTSTTARWHDYAIAGIRAVESRAFSPSDHRLLETAVRDLGGVEVSLVVPRIRPLSSSATWPPSLWTPSDFGTTAGLHAAVVAGFGRTGVVLVTWGRTYDVTWRWLEEDGIEAMAILPSIYVRAGHGPDGSLSAIRRSVFDHSAP